MRFRDFISRPPGWFGLGALAVIMVPPIVLGPYLPFHDLVAFVGLDTYPAQKSSGPFHYEVFQFTYILHLAIARMFSALGLGPGAQIVLFYLGQAVAQFYVLWRILVKWVPEPWLAGVAIAAGSLCFWDGQFLWGGPLPFSIAGTMLAFIAHLVLQEMEPGQPNATIPILTLSLLSVVSHPFALPFAVLLIGFRFVVCRSRRWQCLGVVSALILLGLVIARDSWDPDDNSGKLGKALLSINPGQFVDRFTALFTMDVTVARYLFGFMPALLQAYLILTGTLHVVGFATAPYVVWKTRDQPALRAFMALNTAVGLMYFLTPSLENILPWWPQRILTIFCPFTFAAGIVGPCFLLRRKWPALFAFEGRWLAWAAPVALLGAMVLVQWPVLRLARTLGDEYARIRDGILETNLSNAVVTVTDAGQIQPVFLRAVPFLLFSDPALVKRGLLFNTEWHLQARHPTRLVENWFLAGRTQYAASFGVQDGHLRINLSAGAPGEFTLSTGNNAIGALEMAKFIAGRGDILAANGYLRDAAAQYLSAIRLTPDSSKIQYNLGVVFFQLGETPKAVEYLETSIRLDPTNAGAYSTLGYILLAIGRTDEAAARFETALRLKPDLAVGSSRVDLQACKLEYSIVSPK